MRIVGFVLVTSCFVAAGCGGGASAPPAEAPTKASTPEPAPAPPPVAQPETPKPGPTEPSAAPEPKAADPDATRTVTYTVVPGGALKISVVGIKFTVTAAAVKIGQGWGVKVAVVGSAADGKPHSLSNPKAGPLAFAGSVQRKGAAEPERFGDERVGDDELAIFGDDPTKFTRTWPAKGTRLLSIGDSLDLQIGLWGLGTEKDASRPVKQFCHVRMQVDKNLPRAILEAPASASGR